MAFTKLCFEWDLPGHTRPVRLDWIRCWFNAEPIIVTIFCRDSHQLEEITVPPRSILWDELYDFLLDWATAAIDRENGNFDRVVDLVVYMSDFLRTPPMRG